MTTPTTPDEDNAAKDNPASSPDEMPSTPPHVDDHGLTLEVKRLGKQIGKLEDHLSQEIIAIRERLARIETRFDYTATQKDVAEAKASISATETQLIKWIVGTGIAIAAIVIAAIKLFH